MTKCPVCDSPFRLEFETRDGPIYEQELICGHCDYHYEFSHGSYRVTVQGQIFEWGYYDPYIQARACNEVIQRARAALYSV